MAKYSITHSCGHESVQKLYGAKKQREQRVAELECEMCAECVEKRYGDKNKINAQHNKQAGLNPLVGSEKQVAWAETIRATAYQEFQQTFHFFIERPEDKPIPTAVKGYLNGIKAEIKELSDSFSHARLNALREMMLDYTTRKSLSEKATAYLFDNADSAFWIDNRFDMPNALGKIMARNLLAVIDEVPTTSDEQERQMQIDATIEATLYPTDNKKLIPVHIRTNDNKIILNYDKQTYDLLSRLGFTCSAGVATMQCLEQHGSIEDRIAETIALLLESGVAVRCYHAQAREKALNNTYEPHHKYWISEVEDDMVVIPHFRDDKLYHQIRKIKGSKWKSKCLVPIAMYEDILGFAKVHDYKITQEILRLFDEQRVIEEHKLLAPENFQAKKATRKRTKDKSTPVVINPDLMDDD